MTSLFEREMQNPRFRKLYEEEKEKLKKELEDEQKRQGRAPSHGKDAEQFKAHRAAGAAAVRESDEGKDPEADAEEAGHS